MRTGATLSFAASQKELVSDKRQTLEPDMSVGTPAWESTAGVQASYSVPRFPSLSKGDNNSISRVVVTSPSVTHAEHLDTWYVVGPKKFLLQMLTLLYSLLSYKMQRVRWLDHITNSMDVNLGKLRGTVQDRGVVHGDTT